MYRLLLLSWPLGDALSGQARLDILAVSVHDGKERCCGSACGFEMGWESPR